ncbi:unnamed protein product [marine sediment metagenome]|uniref:Uncharacterized protein n=1 Tax=marine sediment metagenome TaxID=412755 RepID=X1A8B3_9ZZZZ
MTYARGKDMSRKDIWALGECPICGDSVAQVRGAGRPKKYCKNACRQIAYRKRKFVRAATRFWGEKG